MEDSCATRSCPSKSSGPTACQAPCRMLSESPHLFLITHHREKKNYCPCIMASDVTLTTTTHPCFYLLPCCGSAWVGRGY